MTSTVYALKTKWFDTQILCLKLKYMYNRDGQERQKK